MSKGDWADERARWVDARMRAKNWQQHEMIVPLITTALRDAADRATAAERARILAQLQEPSEALILVIAAACRKRELYVEGPYPQALNIARAIAAALAAPEDEP